MSGGHKRRAYLATCIGLAKSDPRWLRSVLSDWNQQSEAERKANRLTPNSLRPIHIALIKLALHRVGEAL